MSSLRHMAIEEHYLRSTFENLEQVVSSEPMVRAANFSPVLTWTYMCLQS
jgi:hypothetical protein